MSRRHKHRYDFELERRRALNELQRQFLILILILLMYSNKVKPAIYKIKCCTKKESSPTYTGGSTLFREKSNIRNEADIIQEVHGGDIGLDKILGTNSTVIIEDIDKMVKGTEILEIENSYKAAENLNTLKDKPAAIYSNIKVYNVTKAECNLIDNLEEFEIQSVARLPVLLSSTKVQFLVEALNQFPEQVFEIKDIDKKVIIKECKLISGTNKLFIMGIIQESIEYANSDCVEIDGVSGVIKSAVFDIPFKGSAKVSFITEPENLEYFSEFEIQVLNAIGSGANINERCTIQNDFLNKNVFAELDSIEILETDIEEEIKYLSKNYMDAHTFKNIRGKIVVNLVIHLLQEQRVYIKSQDI